MLVSSRLPLQGMQGDAARLEEEWAALQRSDTLAGSPKLAAARIAALGEAGLTAEALTALEEFAAGTVTQQKVRQTRRNLM